jgi:hypothetical protein
VPEATLYPHQKTSKYFPENGNHVSMASWTFLAYHARVLVFQRPARTRAPAQARKGQQRPAAFQAAFTGAQRESRPHKTAD